MSITDHPSQADIARIRERTDITAVIGRHVQLTPAGGDSLKGACPFCAGPAFHVRPAHGHWHCFGCSEGGDVYTFVQKHGNVTFAEAVEQFRAEVTR